MKATRCCSIHFTPPCAFTLYRFLWCDITGRGMVSMLMLDGHTSMYSGEYSPSMPNRFPYLLRCVVSGLLWQEV